MKPLAWNSSDERVDDHCRILDAPGDAHDLAQLDFNQCPNRDDQDERTPGHNLDCLEYRHTVCIVGGRCQGSRHGNWTVRACKSHVGSLWAYRACGYRSATWGGV